MFLYDKFCHVASNERWQKQGALFVYETIDTLGQITTAGYFNRAKLDLNLGDLIFVTIITEQETTTYETYVLRVIGLDENVVVESVEFTDLSELDESVSTIQADVNSLKTNVAGKVNIAQGADNAGKVMTVGADGNVVPTAGYATESWVNQQIQTQIGTIETALAEV